MRTSLHNDSDIKEAKQLIRASFKLIRNNLEDSFIQNKSNIIYKKFENYIKN